MGEMRYNNKVACQIHIEGGQLSWLEYLVDIEGVDGSNPLPPTIHEPGCIHYSLSNDTTGLFLFALLNQKNYSKLLRIIGVLQTNYVLISDLYAYLGQDMLNNRCIPETADISQFGCFFIQKLCCPFCFRLSIKGNRGPFLQLKL